MNNDRGFQYVTSSFIDDVTYVYIQTPLFWQNTVHVMFRRAKRRVVMVRLSVLSSWLPKHKGFARESCYGFEWRQRVTSSKHSLYPQIIQSINLYFIISSKMDYNSGYVNDFFVPTKSCVKIQHSSWGLQRSTKHYYYTSYIFMTESRVLIGPLIIACQVSILLLPSAHVSFHASGKCPWQVE